MFRQYLYKRYILALSGVLVVALIIIRWKRGRIRANARICGLSYTLGFRIRFYQAAASDLLRFLHGRYGGPITSRPRDAARIDQLRSGPSLFLTAHFHHWEHMGAWMTRQGIPLLSAARPMTNPRSQSLLVRLRERMDMAVVFQDIPRRALRHVNQGGCFGLLWDQRVASPDPAEPDGAAGSPDKEMGLFGALGLRIGSVAPSPEEAGSRPSYRPRPRANLFGRSLVLDPLPHFLTRHVSLPVFFGVLLPGGRFRVFQIAGPRGQSSQDPASRQTAIATATTIPASLHEAPKSSDPYRHLGRRYHRILERLVRAYPAYWYGLAHGRFQGSAVPE